ncbi:MAG: phospho-sugar mutase [Clostridia bacterium]|nr:phospho-sugar mutase [Clostridia bacterium]
MEESRNGLTERIGGIYPVWREKATADPDLIPELREMEGNDARITDAFYRDLEFGTAGLRGVIGAGTNRMNVYTVTRATRGLARYLVAKAEKEGRRPSAAVCCDSRIKSRLFAETTARVFASEGVRVYIWRTLMPVPCLSFTVRELSCDAGVMITASHNPSEYNGYKVFGPDGCQITSDSVVEISGMIASVGYFEGDEPISFEEGLSGGMISFVPDGVYDSYVRAVKARSTLRDGSAADRNIKIVYSPLNGAGLLPVTRVLGECGFGRVTVVKKQREPDGRFPTCPFPNPELPEALSIGISRAKALGADVMFATDPDCDRIGVAARDDDGSYRVLTGNQIGTLLLEYICSTLRSEGRMPERPVCVKTIVTAGICEKIAAAYGVECHNVLTGFKYIGEYIGQLEAEGREDSFVFGFEESCGYLSGSYVRDKDGVVASMLLCELAAVLRAKGSGLCRELRRIYAKYGYALNEGVSYYFKGIDGFERMENIMVSLRRVPEKIGGLAVTGMKDYAPGLDGLPPSDVVAFSLEGGSSVIIRPSGTEPKLKAYFEVSAPDRENAGKIMSLLKEDVAAIMK